MILSGWNVVVHHHRQKTNYKKKNPISLLFHFYKNNNSASMKLLLSLIFLSSSFSSFAQQIIPGNYLTHQKDMGFETEMFQLYEDGTFIYTMFHCMGIDFGKLP